ncbi:MAG: SDR family oxidoreductase [Bacteroidetes bacterium]|nr:MAG: SDR family oxidoreductase [Bacteroidota bacterium]
MQGLAGKTALVTGAAGGIGRATALMLASHGTRLFLSDLQAAACEETAEMIRSAGGDAHAMQADISDETQVAALFERLKSTFGSLDIAVNNAGIEGGTHPFVAYPSDTWHKVIAVNLSGVFFCMRAEIELMKGGSIVNVASVAGISGFAYHAAYSASKHGVVGLTRSAAQETARKGLRVNAVCPAFTQTDMVDRISALVPQVAEKLLASVPMRRLATPEEIASAIVWLSSGESSFITGHCLVADGGLRA